MKSMKRIAVTLICVGVVFSSESLARDAVGAAVIVSAKNEGNTSLNYPWVSAGPAGVMDVSLGHGSGHSLQIEILVDTPWVRVVGSYPMPWRERSLTQIGGASPSKITRWNATSRWNWTSKEYESVLTATHGVDHRMCMNMNNSSHIGGVKTWLITASGATMISDTIAQRNGCD